MLEEEIFEACDKWLDSLEATMGRMLRDCSPATPFDSGLYRRYAALDALVGSLQAYSKAYMDLDAEAGKIRRKTK